MAAGVDGNHPPTSFSPPPAWEPSLLLIYPSVSSQQPSDPPQATSMQNSHREGDGRNRGRADPRTPCFAIPPGQSAINIGGIYCGFNNTFGKGNGRNRGRADPHAPHFAIPLSLKPSTKGELLRHHQILLGTGMAEMRAG